MPNIEHTPNDSRNEGREENFMDIDRMINEGLGGGNVTLDNGLIEETTTDTMQESDSVINRLNGEKERGVIRWTFNGPSKFWRRPTL